MYQLKTQDQQFDFLSKVDFCSTYEIGQYLGGIYEMSYDTQANLDDCMELTEIPTRFILLTTAWGFFEERYMHYALNGHGGSFEADIRQRVEDGEDTFDIVNELEELRDRNASFHLHYAEGQLDKIYLKEILRSLDTFNFTYFKDTGDLGIFSSPETVKATDLVNPYIKEVW